DMLMGKSQQKFRQNPRKSWYDEVNEVTTNGDFEASFNLKRPQPALLSLLASGYTPVYPCHVSPGDMRTKPVGTGPFKFVEFKANESFKLTRNPDYWKKGLPQDRKSTRLNSSHLVISYAVFCLKKKKKNYSTNIIKNTQKNTSHSTSTLPPTFHHKPRIFAYAFETHIASNLILFMK